MSFENCKIENYATSISDLPDCPSESGYTAEALKALFDARSDGEIKEKHNALVDAVTEKAAELENDILDTKVAVVSEAKAYADGLGANYDPVGSAAEAEARAKEYADGLGANYDPAGSAAEAETRAKEYADGAIAEAIASITNLDEVGF